MHFSSGEALHVQHTSNDAQATSTLQRVIHSTVVVHLQGSNTPLLMKATCLSERGVSALYSGPLPLKHSCEIKLSLFVGGVQRKLSAAARVGSCVCAGDAFRIGFAFVALDDSTKALVARMLQA